MNITCYLHHPGDLSSRSGMFPLAEALSASVVFYEGTWWKIQERSFRLGDWARRWGQKVYGSEWNSLLPGWDERWIAARTQDAQDVAHFLWGEFAAPIHPARFRRKARLLVATFHASSSRLPTILGNSRTLHNLDGITLMSEQQKSFFMEKGFPEKRIQTILHGVDTTWFYPSDDSQAICGGRDALQGFMIGVTERDHAFLADVMRSLPPGILKLNVATSEAQRVHYHNIPGVEILPRLSDDELREQYRQSDLLMMPVMDCTANNSILESMACGTPVMVNRIGGISEYVPETANIVMPDKNVDDWVGRIHDLAAQRDQLIIKRSKVRAWAETLDWHLVARRYIEFYYRLGIN
ncbi:MAG TPA: glycosyltransferase family 4 protein [Kiritimatiellia bacterium]|nr:glycosyltransferase family 4 protein [Kiritimatiellia bacterium]